MKSRITRQRFQPLLAVAALLAALLPLGELIAAEPLAFGVLPRRNAQLTARLFTPLAEHLSAAIGRPVELILSKDYDAFSQSIANERFDIVHFNQFHYIKARFEHGYQVFARNREGGSDLIEAAIFTRSGSGVYRLADLKGRKVMFGGGRQAMISYIASRYLLREAGLQDDDYTSLIARNPPNAMVASFVGEADAAAAATHVRQLPVIRKAIDVSEMVLVGSGEPLAHLPWAFHPRLPEELKESIATILTGLDQSGSGRELLRQAQLDGLVPTSDGDYDRHRQIVLEVLGVDYRMAQGAEGSE